ncbi:MAG: c-type cytochrome [Acidimicrobiales bacterium]
MVHKLWTGCVAAALVVVSVLVAAAEAGGSTIAAGGPGPTTGQDDVAAGALVYSDTCARCHQADGLGTPGTFPPLVGNPRAADPGYVETVVRDGLSGPIEVLGTTYDDEMRGFPDLSDDDIAAVVAYVGSLARRDASATPAVPAAELEPGDIDDGHDLFTGSARLGNGGAACAACHTAGQVGNLGGSGLGPDLTTAFDDFGGERGLSAWLSDPPSATMQPIFGDHPLTPAEIADLVAFLGDAPAQPRRSDRGDGLLVAGAAGLLVLIGGTTIAWRGMRQTYVERLRSRR